MVHNLASDEKRRALRHIENLGNTKSSRLHEECLRECHSRLAAASLGAASVLADRSNGSSQFCTRSCGVQSLDPPLRLKQPRGPPKEITWMFVARDPIYALSSGTATSSRGSKSAMTPLAALSYLVPLFFPAPQRCLSLWCAAMTDWQACTLKAWITLTAARECSSPSLAGT